MCMVEILKCNEKVLSSIEESVIMEPMEGTFDYDDQNVTN